LKKILQILNQGHKLYFLGEVKNYYILIIFLIGLYILTKNLIVGLLAGFAIFFFFLFEVYEGIKSHGIKKEIFEIFLALVLAGGVWFGLGFLLNTSSPINAIVSCSMLPSYDRGDLIILEGGKIKTNYFDYDGEIKQILDNGEVYYREKRLDLNYSIYVYCLYNPNEDICQIFKTEPNLFYEKYGPIKLQYDLCKKYYKKNNLVFQTPCIKKAYYNDKEIPFSKDLDLIVYTPKKTEIYGQLGGDIIHRSIFAIRSKDGVYYFTKGDNNPIYDFQFSQPTTGYKNLAPTSEQLKGRVILKIPYIGNVKLVITPQVLLLSDEQTGCGSYFID